MIRRSYSKYRAVKQEVDGITFASKREAVRYCELKMLEKAGEIRLLQLQVPFELRVGAHRLGAYFADFVYEEKQGQDWCIRVEDVKSPPTRTPIYRWKVKHVAAQYGITVREV